MQNSTLQQSSLTQTENSFYFRELNKNGKVDICEDSCQPIDNLADDLLKQMTLEEKADIPFDPENPLHPFGFSLSY